MSIKLDLSENITGYKDDLEKDIISLETELNSISISLNIISKQQINKIDNLFTECENNVRIIINRIFITNLDKTYRSRTFPNAS